MSRAPRNERNTIMGCDIHVHTEIKVAGQWHHYGCPSVGRWYSMFGKIAGVRREDEHPIDYHRGIPSDATMLTRIEYGPDADPSDYWHHAGWLDEQQMDDLDKWIQAHRPENESYHGIEDEIGYLYHNGWNAGEVNGTRIEDVRMIFWFDN
jgi:hypothetical protein